MMGVAQRSKQRGGRREGSGRKKRFEDRVTICFEEALETRDQLDTLAAKLDTTRSDLIRAAIQDLLKTHGV